MRSATITSALVNALLADAALRALAPDGVFIDVADKSLLTGGTPTRFVIVSFVIATNVLVFQRRSHTDALYLVEARILSTSVAHARTVAADAAARIDAILDPQPPLPPAAFTIPGHRLMALYQDEPTEVTEFNDQDPAIVWHRGGGRYHLWTAPIAA